MMGDIAPKANGGFNAVLQGKNSNTVVGQAPGQGSLLIGTSRATAPFNITIGDQGLNGQERSVVIGHRAVATGPSTNSVVIGTSAAALTAADGSIVIGKSSISNNPGQVVIGNTANNNGNAKADTIFIGNGANGTNTGANGGIAIGAAAFFDNGSVAIGYSAAANTEKAVIIGYGAGTSPASAAPYVVAVGHSSGSSGSSVGHNSVCLGAQTVSQFQSECVLVGGGFASTTDAKMSFVKMWSVTSNATPLELKTGFNTSITTTITTAPVGVIILENDSTYLFDCDIVARNTATDTESAAWNLKFAIRRGAAAANTALIGTPTKTIYGQDTGSTTWDVSATADTTNGRPNISVTGEAAKTIRWVANIRLTKVSG